MTVGDWVQNRPAWLPMRVGRVVAVEGDKVLLEHFDPGSFKLVWWLADTWESVGPVQQWNLTYDGLPKATA